ncbi:hypothetical protein [Macrococcus armenti]|uniref:Uncharacterized protein n=1 Tax=Macrococcus armenti TaxID=2875764 RepID=A0ABY3ZX20_9STAP|nr:hypothetical protein [Macrococcus armenti]UOB21467.1 hypothetical protein MRZ06_05135 [Macrococcus armenti]
MNIKLTDENIAIINDALKHVESTTDVLEYIGTNSSREDYKKAFLNTLEKLNKISNDETRKGAFYFQK